MINMQIKGLEQALAQIAARPGAIRTRVEKELDASATELRTVIVKNLSKAGTGRVYKRRSVRHRASAPGMPPAVDTGRLRSSVHIAPDELRRIVFTNLKYARPLEFGTRKMKARPFFFPSFEAYKPRYVERMKRALADVTSAEGA